MTLNDRIFEMLVLFYHWPKKVSQKTYRLWFFILLGELVIFWLSTFNFQTDQQQVISDYFLKGLYGLLGLTGIGFLLFERLRGITLFRLIPFTCYLFSMIFVSYFGTIHYDYRLVEQLPLTYLVGFSCCVIQWAHQLYHIPKLKEKYGIRRDDTLLNHYMTKKEKDVKYGTRTYGPFVFFALLFFVLMTIGYMFESFIGPFLLTTFSNLAQILLMGVCMPVSFTQAFDVFYEYYEENE